MLSSAVTHLAAQSWTARVEELAISLRHSLSVADVKAVQSDIAYKKLDRFTAARFETKEHSQHH